MRRFLGAGLIVVGGVLFQFGTWGSHARRAWDAYDYLFRSGRVRDSAPLTAVAILCALVGVALLLNKVPDRR